MKGTIELMTNAGRVPVPIKRRVLVAGVPGFAVHRSLVGNGTSERYWNVSHIESGLSLASFSRTIKEALTEAESLLSNAAKRRGVAPAELVASQARVRR